MRGLLNPILLRGDGMGLFERTHLSDKSTEVYDAARVAVCTASASWYLLTSFTADQQRGPLAS